MRPPQVLKAAGPKERYWPGGGENSGFPPGGYKNIGKRLRRKGRGSKRKGRIRQTPAEKAGQRPARLDLWVPPQGEKAPAGGLLPGKAPMAADPGDLVRKGAGRSALLLSRSRARPCRRRRRKKISDGAFGLRTDCPQDTKPQKDTVKFRRIALPRVGARAEKRAGSSCF